MKGVVVVLLLAVMVLLGVAWVRSGCEVWQLPNAVVVACPGRDLMRVWPLPVVVAWSED